MRQQKQEVTKKLEHMKIRMTNNLAGVVRPDAIEETIGLLFIPTESQKEPDTGIVVEGPENLVGKRVRFKTAYGEDLEIDGVKVKWFSDIKNSLYYIIEDAD